MRGRLPLWGVLGLLVSARAFGVGETLSPLFVMEKSSQTRNVVHYDAHLRPDGTFDPAQPVVAYWVMGERDGRRQDLNLLERTKAYGFTAAAGSGEGPVKLTLVADRARQITIQRTPQGIRAETRLSGHKAILRRIFITTRRTMLLDLPEKAELFGDDLETGEERSEVVTR